MEYPDFQDSMSRVSVTLDNGDVVFGVIIIDDYTFNGEDEFPICSILLDDDKKLCPFSELDEDWDQVEIVNNGN
ncbi:hypothetical protein [Vibrio phage 2E1]|nr:hypothetical protein [Vibrio phage 2E1]